MMFLRSILWSLFLCGIVLNSNATTFDLPAPENALIGHVKTAAIQTGENLGDFLRRHHIGFFELLEANPHANLDSPRGGTRFVIPARYILPPLKREGVVINLAELRLYYYASQQHKIFTYPVGIGREGADTPVIDTEIIEKRKKPIWIPTPETRARELLMGVVLPDVVRPGPQNPLGEYALRLGRRDYSIHGTNDIYGVGLRISAGCIRMYPEDIKDLFERVEVGTPVHIINNPVKVGWEDDFLYAEAQVPMNKKEQEVSQENYTVKPLIDLLKQEVTHDEDIKINWIKAKKIGYRQRGIPVRVGQR